jgi:hypothetical protein
MKQAIAVATALIVVCATFWFANAESWLRRGGGSTIERQIYHA